MTPRNDVLILGAGVTGLAAAATLGSRATVLERDDRPGGLVRTDRIGDCWFDRVLHLLYFQDPGTERRIHALLGDVLAPCPPRAWVETSRGTTRFPIQSHLGGLDAETCVRCLDELAALAHGPAPAAPANFEELLLASFGRTLCETFLLPYNRKMWKRPLGELAPSGFTWNIARPNLVEALRGAVAPSRPAATYNANGWYPRPPVSAPVRGMELLSIALAECACDMRVGHCVEHVDLRRRVVTARRGDGGAEQLGWNDALLSTMPLPALIAMCEQTPDDLRAACRRLRRNRVVSVALVVAGPRPEEVGHWRYYGDESLVFTRLSFPHEFDPLAVPVDRWGILVEIPQRGEDPMTDADELVRQAVADVERCGVMPAEARVTLGAVTSVDPAYVVFTPESQPIVEHARAFLAQHGVTSLGRYGSWEYSGMSTCLRDGFAWATQLVEAPGAAIAGGASHPAPAAIRLERRP